MDKELLNKVHGFLLEKGVKNVPADFDEFSGRLNGDDKLVGNVFNFMKQQNIKNFPSDETAFRTRIFGEKKKPLSGESVASVGTGSELGSTSAGQEPSQGLPDRFSKIQNSLAYSLGERGLFNIIEPSAPDDGEPSMKFWRRNDFSNETFSQKDITTYFDVLANEQAGTDFKNLPQDKQSEIFSSFSEEYLDDKSMQQYMADNNLDLDLDKLDQAQASAGQGALGTIAGGFSGAPKLLEAYQDQILKGRERFFGEDYSKLSDAEKRQKRESMDFGLAIWANASKEVGDMLKDELRQIKTNPKLAEDYWATTLPQALGSAVPFMATGGPTGAAVLGATSNADALQEEAQAAGASEETQQAAMGLGAVIGASESLVMGKIAQRVTKGNTGGTFVGNTTKEGIEEAIQESVTEALNNLTAQQLYDESREITQGLKQAAEGGAGAGVVMSAASQMLGGIRKRKSQATTQEDLSALEKAEENLSEFIDQNEESNDGSGQLPSNEDNSQTSEPESSPLEGEETEQGVQETPELEAKDESVPYGEPRLLDDESPIEQAERPKPGADDGEIERRSFSEQVENSEELDPAIAYNMTEDSKFYKVKSNELTASEASSIIEEEGALKTKERVLNPETGLSPRVRIAAGQQLIKKFNEEGDIESAVDVAEGLSKLGTEMGQGIQAFSMFDKLTPEGRLVAVERQNQRNKKSFQKKNKRRIQNTKAKIKKAREDSITEAVKNSVTPKAKKPAKQKKFTATRAQIKKRKADALARFKKSTGQLNTGVNTEAISAMTEYATMTVMEAGLDVAEFTAHMVETFGEFATPERIKSIWESEFEGRKLSQIAVEGREAKIMSGEMRNMDIDLRKLAKEHIDTKESTKEDLVRAIQDKFKVSEPFATQLANDIRSKFDEQMNEKTKSVLERMRKKPTNERQATRVKESFDKAIELSNLGAFDQDMDNAISDIMGAPEISLDTINKINDLAKKVQAAPEGRRRNEELRKLNDLMDNAGEVSNWDFWTGIRFANMLSGPETHMLNISANFVNGVLETGITAIEGIISGDAKAGIEAVRGYMNGLDRALSEAKASMENGPRTVKASGDKIGRTSALEKYSLKDDLTFRNVTAGVMKFVPRLLYSADAFFFYGNAEASAYVQAYRQAKSEGYSGSRLKQRRDDILSGGMSFNDAMSQARVESGQLANAGLKPYSPSELKLRAYDIIEENRPEELVDESHEFGQYATFNYDPRGIIGSLAKKVNAIKAQGGILGKATDIIIPFVSTIGNVLNQNLSYTPWGYVRILGAKNGWGELQQWEAKSPEEFRKQLIRATLGSTTLMVLMALALKGLDDEEEGVQIYGGGPLNWDDRSTLYNTGWKPHTIKIGDTYINYKDYTFGLVMSIVGNVIDSIRYEQGGKSTSERAAYGLMLTMPSLMESSFLSGISGVMDLFTRPKSAESFTDKALLFGPRQALSFVTPNAIAQIDRMFDPTIYSNDDISERILRQVPFARRSLRENINILGEPISRSGMVPIGSSEWLQRFGSYSGDTPEHWKLLVEKKIKIKAPGRRSKVGNHELKDYPDALYDYKKAFGEELKKRIISNLDQLRLIEDDRAQKVVDGWVSKSREKAKRTVLKKHFLKP